MMRYFKGTLYERVETGTDEILCDRCALKDKDCFMGGKGREIPCDPGGKNV